MVRDGVIESHAVGGHKNRSFPRAGLATEGI